MTTSNIDVIKINTEFFCEPINDLETILNWNKSLISWNKYVQIKNPRTNYVYDATLNNSKRYLKGSIPKTLLCHDMKGGYLEDKYIHGAKDVIDPYVFAHWNHVDIFVYFSHHFITIPPLMWINAAHTHGVEILGTIITEWKDGEKIWQELFNDEIKLNLFIDKLIELCKHIKFDGYLINIENIIQSEHIDKMKYFVKQLTKKLHNEIKDSIIIWYDSIICPTGELKWQNELNNYNKDFFQICDGIFLNYNWTEATLINSLKNSGERYHDVYVGLDVFGRDCFGGGGFNSNLALEIIRKFNLSVAIFGHGWTHETKKENEIFEERENLFWNKLKSYLYNHVVKLNSFHTNFNKGYGKHNFINGYKNNNEINYNLSKQNIQSCITNIYELNEGYNGYGCISIQEMSKYMKLYNTNIEIIEPFRIFIITKSNTIYDYSLYILCEEINKQQQKHKYILRKEITNNNIDFSTTIIHQHNPSDNGNEHKCKKLNTGQLDWEKLLFIIQPINLPINILEIGIEVITQSKQMLLGEINIKQKNQCKMLQKILNKQV